jgi:pimeloyl-ACP methyl ester carboxylesterase
VAATGGSRVIPRFVLVAVILAAGVSVARPAAHAGAAPAMQLAPCSGPRSTSDARCGTHPVFEDRARRSGRIIHLKVLVLPALTEKPAPDPVFVLSGGPGTGAATGVTHEVVEFFRPMRQSRDVVFVDQRGTGESHRLQCRLAGDGATAQSGFGELFPPDKVRACRQALETIADLRLYTTPIAMDDLDDVRAALGYASINLYGVSYGSLAALQYLRQYPARVRSLALAGVATPAQKLPLHFAGAAQAALDHLIADCAADEACHREFRDLGREVTAVLARFDPGPVTFDLPKADGTESESVSMSRPVFAERLRLMLYDLRSARRVPLVLHRAAHGDWVPFARATSPTLTGLSPAFAMGMYLTVTCSESVPTITEDEIVRASRGSFLGEERTRAHARACQEWPRGSIPADFYLPVVSRVPVLMLSGELDAATPAHYGAAAARSLPNSHQILIRNAAHAYFDDCLRDLVADFVAKGSARGQDTRCVEALRRPPFVLSPPAAAQ